MGLNSAARECERALLSLELLGEDLEHELEFIVRHSPKISPKILKIFCFSLYEIYEGESRYRARYHLTDSRKGVN